MKEYATLSSNSHNLDRAVNGASYSTPYDRRGDRDYPGYGVTLHDLLAKGWRVISSAIEPANCSHGETRFLFLLERDAQ